jgi:hypothetical protein
MLELLSEPFYILAQTRLLFGLRVAIETLAIISKASLMLLLLYANAAPPAIAVSWAQAWFDILAARVLTALHFKTVDEFVADYGDHLPWCCRRLRMQR